VIVRRDLPAPQVVVQAVHAAIDSARHHLPVGRPHPHLVLCRVPGEPELLAAADRLDRLGIRIHLFREPDHDGETTALATEPLGPDRRGPLARYPCLTRSDLLFAASSCAGSCDPAPRPGPGDSSEDVP
jgi:hypothetical protein